MSHPQPHVPALAPVPVAIAALALGLVAASGGPAHAQTRPPQPDAAQDAGLLAQVSDRSLSAIYNAQRQATEVTLDLVPVGSGGSPASVALTFHTQFPGRSPRVTPSLVQIRAHVGPLSDQRLERRTELVFELDKGTDSPARLFYFGSAWGYGGFTPPGDQLPLVRFNVATSELRALARAATVSGDALGFAFELTPAQLTALRAFASLIRAEDERETP